jgi:excisionase family DNA binding protein
MHEIICAINRLKERIMDLASQVEFLAKSPSQQLTRKYLDTESACKILHVSDRTLLKMRNEGAIPFSRIRRRILYEANDIHNFIESRFRKN